jgi:hypothetical protein
VKVVEDKTTTLEAKTAAANTGNAGRVVVVGSDGNLAAPLTMEAMGQHIAENIDLSDNTVFATATNNITNLQNALNDAETGILDRLTATEGVANTATTNIGTMSGLNTTATNLVGAINEVRGDAVQSGTSGLVTVPAMPSGCGTTDACVLLASAEGGFTWEKVAY